jgi:hypothetical protein
MDTMIGSSCERALDRIVPDPFEESCHRDKPPNAVADPLGYGP